MPYLVEEVLKKYVDDIKRIYEDKLKTIILYGSYARGDFSQESDIDIMILVDLSDEEIREKGHTLSDVTYDYNYDNNIQIMPVVKNHNHFNRWIRAYRSQQTDHWQEPRHSL